MNKEQILAILIVLCGLISISGSFIHRRYYDYDFMIYTGLTTIDQDIYMTTERCTLVLVDPDDLFWVSNLLHEGDNIKVYSMPIPTLTYYLELDNLDYYQYLRRREREAEYAKFWERQRELDSLFSL